MKQKPMTGIKVIELGQLIAGPFAGKFFAEFGAEVIKIEPPAVRGPGGPIGGGDPLPWTRQHDADDLVRLLNLAQVPNGKIYSIADIVSDPQYIARDMIRTVQLDDGTSLKVPGIVPKLSATPGDIDAPGPALGQHTDELLHLLGYDAARIAALRDAGAI